MRRINVGIIGTGWCGGIRANACAANPLVDGLYIAEIKPERLAEVAATTNPRKATTEWRELLDIKEIDAIYISATPETTHYPMARDCLNAGKHVFLEKPIASTVSDAQKITAAGAKAKAKGNLFIGHICRFNPRYRMAKQAIAAGKIGRIVAMNSRRNIPAAWTPEILNKIGPIVGDAIHDTDLMLWFTGDRIVSAYAQTVDVRGLRHPDIGQTMYRFAGGATATLETVWCMPEKTPFDIDERMSIIGDAGLIHVQDTFPNLGIVSSEKLHSPDTTYWPVFDGPRGGALREEFSYFASCALKGEAPAIGRPEDAAAALQATLAAEESARTGQVVRIDG